MYLIVIIWFLLLVYQFDDWIIDEKISPLDGHYGPLCEARLTPVFDHLLLCQTSEGNKLLASAGLLLVVSWFQRFCFPVITEYLRSWRQSNYPTISVATNALLCMRKVFQRYTPLQMSLFGVLGVPYANLVKEQPYVVFCIWFLRQSVRRKIWTWTTSKFRMALNRRRFCFNVPPVSECGQFG